MDSGAPTELLIAIVAATRERLGAAACSVALLEGAELEFVAAAGAGAGEVIGMRMPAGRGIAGWVVASGQTMAVADTHSDRRFDRETAEQTGYLPSTILATPIEGEDGPIGVLEVLDRVSDPQDMQVAADAARQVALVLELADAGARVDAALADPALAELVALLRRLQGLDDAHRHLAAQLLTAVVEHAQ